MEISITIWIVGWLFTMGVASNDSPSGANLITNIIGWIILIIMFAVSWPLYLGRHFFK